MSDSNSLLLNLTDYGAEGRSDTISRRYSQAGTAKQRSEKRSKGGNKAAARHGGPKPQAQPSRNAASSALKGYKLEDSGKFPQPTHGLLQKKVPFTDTSTDACGVGRGVRRQQTAPEFHRVKHDEPSKPVETEVKLPALGEEDEEGLQEAIALSLQKDHKLSDQSQQLHLENRNNEEEDKGVVSFVDERYDHSRMQKRRKKEDIAPEKAAKKRKGLGNVHPKAGELVHAGGAVPEELRAALSGAQGASTFADLGIAESLSSHLEEMNFTDATTIQQQCIPVLLARRDALVNAPTGSGKTLAYLAPIIHDLQGEQPRLNRGDGTFAVIVAPTRELCIQISDVMSLILRRYHWLVGGAITGGENRGKEKARLRKGVTVLVATPGRLLDHLQSTSAFHTSELRWLVLDEADRLLDLGFEQKICEIVDILDQRLKEGGSSRRQTVLLSATMHSKLKALASLSLQNPISVGFRDSGTGSAAVVRTSGDAELSCSTEEAEQYAIPKQLVQQFLQVPGRARLAALAGVLCRGTRSQAACKLVVFMSSCDGVEFHHQLLQDAYKHAAGRPLLSCPIWKLHGNLPQKERTQTFLDFSRCSRGVLFCTDVAARGLDFPAVTCIVQYDPPGEATEYVHRVGRTARMGQQGEAILFLLPTETGYLDWLARAGCSIQELDLDWVMQALPSQSVPNGWNRQNLDEPAAAFAFQGQLIAAVSQDSHLRSLAGDAFRSYVRAYATHPATLKDVFHVKRLHLGHVAHSFALKVTPTLLGRSASKAAAKEAKRTKSVGRKGIRGRERKA